MNDIANNDEKKKGGPKGIHKVTTVNTSNFDTKWSSPSTPSNMDHQLLRQMFVR